MNLAIRNEVIRFKNNEGNIKKKNASGRSWPEFEIDGIAAKPCIFVQINV